MGRTTTRLFKRGHAPDYLIIGSVMLLVSLGLVMISSASLHLGAQEFGDTYYYLKHQLLSGLIPGLIGFFLALNVHYRVYKHKAFATAFLGVTIFLLLLVFTPLGVTIKGATRWLSLGFVTFQPAELLKLSLVIYLASWLHKKGKRHTSLKKGFLPFAAIVSVVSIILLVQRSTSPVAILLMVSLIMYYFSGGRLRYILSIIAFGVGSISLIIAKSPYRLQRILTFLDPEKDPTGAGFHTLQAKTAIGAGGLTGVGYGQSTVKYRLPEPIGDSIFAITGEEFGFIGTLIIIALFAFLVIRMLLLAKKTNDRFGKILLIGFGSLIGIQAFVNMGAMTGILPLTGTPLPFVSFGGTALAIFLTMIGITANISRFASRS